MRWEKIPLPANTGIWFEPNRGQVGGRTEWTSRAAGAWLFLTSNEVVYALPPDIKFDPSKTSGVPEAKTTNVHMRMVSGRRVTGVGENPLGGYSNYFVGKNEDEWFTGIPHYGRVRFAEVYPGIDLVYYSTGRNVEYDFIVKPGADPAAIELAFDAAVRVDKAGDLVVSAGGKTFRQRRPRVFQGSMEIEASYRLTERGTVKVEVAGFDPLISLRVDPVLDFSTFLGGPGEDYLGNLAMAVDGNLILTGGTQSPASPVLDPFRQPSVVSAAPIILKMSPDGRRLLFYTILGRNGWDSAGVVSIAKDGAIVLGGTTRSTEFPLKNPFQTEYKAIFSNCWVARLTADGRTLLYSSYMGGTVNEDMRTMALDEAGNSYYAGGTESADFPLLNPLQSRRDGISDAYLTKISPDGKIVFSTRLGGSGSESINALKWRRDGTLILVGGTNGADFPLKDPIQTATTAWRNGWYYGFLAMMPDDGSALRYSTFYGGDSIDTGWEMTLDPEDRIYIGGYLQGRGLPLKNPLFAEAEGTFGSLTIFDPTGRDRLYATLLPGMIPSALQLDSEGSIFIAGSAHSTDFPAKDSIYPFRGGGVSSSDSALLKISPDGRTLLFATVLGGGNGEGTSAMVLGPGKAIYAVGTTLSSDFPSKNAYQGTTGGSFDGYFYRITDDSVLPAASASFAVTPGRLTFRFVQGEAVPAPVPVIISGLNGQVYSALSVPWLRVTPASLGVSGTMVVSVNPAGLAPGVHQGSVRLTPSEGTSTSVDVTLTVLAAAPILSTVEPGLVPVGSDDTEITIRGSGFTNRTTVQIATVPWVLSPLRFVSSTELRFTLPKLYFSAEANHSITVQNPDSAISAPVPLSVGRPAPAIAAKGIVSAASYAGDVISPGEIVTIFGENFETGMQVNFDGLLAAPLYVTAKQLGVVVPAGLAAAREVKVVVQKDFEWRSVPVRMPVWPARPGLFTADSSGRGLAAALNQDGSVNSAGNAAAKRSIVVLWGTGGGVDSLSQKVYMDGMECEVLYAGGKDGLWQLNVRIPAFAVKGEVVWRAGERESAEGVFIALRD